MRQAFILITLFLVAACARPQTTGVSAPDPAATVETIFIATMRRSDQAGQIFGQTRSEQMSFLRAEISVPPIHQIGRIERGSGIVDPRRHFAPLGLSPIRSPGALTSALRSRRTDRSEPLLIFVHGYNNTLEDASFRLAQIQHDFELQNPALLFSWPSAGDPLGYTYDRDSVLFARSDFARLLRELRRAGERDVILLAHSMGGYLVMETLRQLALEGDTASIDMLDGILFMSPDIDPDVFRRQAREIGKLPEPFIIMTTQRDRVLNLASLLSGRKERLGRIRSADEVAGLNVSVIDFSLFERGEAMGHMVPVSSPTAIRFFSRLTGGLSLAGREFSRYVLLGDGKNTRRPAQ